MRLHAVADPVQSLFDLSWADLGREDVVAFLDTAGDEGLTWEAKGDEGERRWPRREQLEKATSAFANSQLGGVLIIGADRREKGRPGWDLRGLHPPAEPEIEVAISKTLRTGVDPIPPFRVKHLGEVDGCHAAIVWIEPVPDPPCVTSGGLVFERATGVSDRITDPSLLARLFTAGKTARKNAEIGALLGASEAMEAGRLVRATYQTPWTKNRDRFSLGVAAVGHQGDIGRCLVSASFRNLLEDLARAHLHTETPELFIEQGRGRVCARVDPVNVDDRFRQWGVWATWAGRVGVACVRPRADMHDRFRAEVLAPAWRVAVRLVVALGGVARGHLAVIGYRDIAPDHAWPSAKDPIQRSIDLPATEEIDDYTPPASDLDYVATEVRRAAGEQIWTGD